MTPGDKLVCWLILNYLVILVVYAYSRDWVRFLYWAGAVAIGVATLLMRFK